MFAEGDPAERMDIEHVLSEVGDKYLKDRGGIGKFGFWHVEDVVVDTMNNLVQKAVLKAYRGDPKTNICDPYYEAGVKVVIDHKDIGFYGPARMEYEIPLKLGEPYEWNDWFKDVLETAVSKVLKRKKIRATDEKKLVEDIYEDVEKELDKAFCEVAQEKLLDRLKSAGFECWEEDEKITCVLKGEPHEGYDDEGKRYLYIHDLEVEIDKC